VLRIKFQTETGQRLRRLQQEMGGNGMSVDSLLSVDDDRWLVALTVGDVTDRTPGVVADLPDVDLLYENQYTESSDTVSLLVLFENVDACIAQTLARRRAVPHAITLRDRALEGTVTVEDWDHLQVIADEIESTHDSFELVSVTKVDHVDAMLGTDQFKHAVRAHVSETQLRTLEHAFRAGYFTVPQEATATEIATELDISQSTFSERLRRSVDELLAVLFGEETDHPELDANEE
jgi:predicted DNA binding protein